MLPDEKHDWTIGIKCYQTKRRRKYQSWIPFQKPGTISTRHVMFNLKKLGKKLIPPTNTEVVHQENCSYRLHLKNTEHMGSDSILKVQNSNSKWTKIWNFISRQITVQNSFRGRLVFQRSWTLHFEGWTLFEVQRSGRLEYFEVKGKWKNDKEKSLLNKILKVHGFPDAF
ncbi:hypothetical protein RclHR1_08380007 [Rhizophagus clarus]|uniref:Uncharacterized protein n=1 Tax=Rhizophagus clarus TaxID=94130 RepID=A0A2Z6S0R6_9GLOM|nr:hypothetical protein RclHR1_08380007 [Rhizophagus clarus]